jgi:hypothetical protein
MTNPCRRWGALTLIAATLLTGCVSSQALTKPDRESLQAVSLNKAVILPEDLYYHGPAQTAAGALGGAVGALVGVALAKEPKAKLKAAMAEGGIDVGQIVREQFESELSAARIFPSMLPEGGDAEFKFEVRIVGFAQPHGFSGQLKPMLGVTGMLVRPDGKVLWKKYEYVTNLNDQTPAYSFDDYIQKPEALRNALTAAAKIVTGALVVHIKESSP